MRHYVKIYGRKIEKVRARMRREMAGWLAGWMAVGRGRRPACVRGPHLRGPPLPAAQPRLPPLHPPTLPPTLPPPQNGKTTVKCPKIQRLVTPQVLQRKRHRAAIKKERIVRKKAEVRPGWAAWRSVVLVVVCLGGGAWRVPVGWRVCRCVAALGAAPCLRARVSEEP